jgi:hypothetical protein
MVTIEVLTILAIVFDWDLRSSGDIAIALTARTALGELGRARCTTSEPRHGKPTPRMHGPSQLRKMRVISLSNRSQVMVAELPA